jgi:hypothetical protein
MGLLALLQKDNTFISPCLSLVMQECDLFLCRINAK